ncbi:MAG: helix-turn-helix domain-containing protein [Candidatus Aureabacteria bacterium]|nr:helix-turn-helix domain-containing protein [Candidatus Auribacterota bacterium]
MGEHKEKELMTEREVREMIRISRTTLWKLRKNEGFPFTKVGRQYRYSKKEILEWMKERKGKKIEVKAAKPRQNALADKPRQNVPAGKPDNIDKKEISKEIAKGPSQLQGQEKGSAKEPEGTTNEKK